MGDMRPKIQYLQLPLAFMTEGRGETPDAGHEGIESPTAKRGPENPATGESLMEEVCEREDLEVAWQQVRSNQGSPGVDGRTIDETRDYLREHWPTIREQLLNGTYRPQPVRRVEIAKPDGGVRKLGIPTVLDRLPRRRSPHSGRRGTSLWHGRSLPPGGSGTSPCRTPASPPGKWCAAARPPGRRRSGCRPSSPATRPRPSAGMSHPG